MNDLRDYELKYYKEICNIQRQYIKGEISKDEMDSICDMERKKFMSWLNEKNLQLKSEIENQMRANTLIRLFTGE